jgi:hypothetical protein
MQEYQSVLATKFSSPFSYRGLLDCDFQMAAALSEPFRRKTQSRSKVRKFVIVCLKPAVIRVNFTPSAFPAYAALV